MLPAVTVIGGPWFTANTGPELEELCIFPRHFLNACTGTRHELVEFFFPEWNSYSTFYFTKVSIILQVTPIFNSDKTAVS